MSARTPEIVEAELRALGRPPMAWATPRALADWQRAIAAWREAHPAGDEAYTRLLAELEALEATRRHRGSNWAVRLGVGARLVEAVATMRPTAYVEGVERWAASAKPWLLLLGDVGTGKSVAAAYACKRAMSAGSSAAWVQAADFARLAGGFDGECAWLQGVDVLVVDDIGTEHVSDFARATLHGVLAARHEDKLRTVLTSNLAGPELRERLGLRLADRIRSECVVVTGKGASLRGVAP